MWTSFGYYDEETDRAVLAALRDRVAGDGALVIELANEEGLLSNYDGDAVDRGVERLTLETREYDPERSRMQTDGDVFEIVEDGYEHVGTTAYDTDCSTLRRSAGGCSTPDSGPSRCTRTWRAGS